MIVKKLLIQYIHFKTRVLKERGGKKSLTIFRGQPFSIRKI